MSSFCSPLDLRHYDGHPTRVATLRALKWEHEYGDNTLTITVPPGFIHNSASIPWFLAWLIRPMESGIIRAAAIHDYGYWKHAYDQREASRREIDYEFRNALEVDGMGPVRRWLAWAAVRVFAFRAWRNAYRSLDRIDHQLVAERNQILHALAETYPEGPPL